MKISMYALAATVFATSFTFNSVSHADLGDAVYPASMCVPHNSGTPTPRLSHSRIYNDSTTRSMGVDCPVPHDNASGPFSNDNFEDQDIGLIDDSTTANIRCWSQAKWQTGTTLNTISGGTVETSGAGMHEQNESFGFAGGRFDSWHYIGCNVPRRQAGRTANGITYYSAEQ